MDHKLNVSEIFFGIQGEGRYCGIPALFVRLCGCTRKCEWCDTKYHAQGKVTPFEILNAEMDQYLPEVTVWTGGEPLLQFDLLEDFLLHRGDPFMRHHLETNGDLIANGVVLPLRLSMFSYVSCSPKSFSVAKAVSELLTKTSGFDSEFDIKVVTDMDHIGMDMLAYATVLMPHTSGDEKRDAEVRKSVWQFCVLNRIRYSPRLHVEVFGTGIRGV